jgi:hypothetical protein
MPQGHRHTAICVAIALVLATGAPHAGQAQRPTAVSVPEPAHVSVIGTDYAFMQLPATLSAGPTLFAFENHGARRHEMSIALLKPGITVESLVTGGERTSVASRAISDSIVGLLLARPGERSGGQLYANLVAGRTYVVICTLRDTPDAHQHADLGMVGSFRVH